MLGQAIVLSEDFTSSTLIHQKWPRAQEGPQLHAIPIGRLDEFTIVTQRGKLLVMVGLDVKIYLSFIRQAAPRAPDQNSEHFGGTQAWGAPARITRQVLALELRAQREIESSLDCRGEALHTPE
jgi:hypothetical protein